MSIFEIYLIYYVKLSVPKLSFCCLPSYFVFCKCLVLHVKSVAFGSVNMKYGFHSLPFGTTSENIALHTGFFFLFNVAKTKRKATTCQLCQFLP